jgi:N-acetylmuramoyl-L-alanine amidase
MHKALVAILCVAMSACGSPSSGTAPVDSVEVAKAQGHALLVADTLPDRFEVVQHADRLAVAAVRGAKSAGVDLTELAAGLRERLFRTTHAESDGREAVLLLERTMDAAEPARACSAAIRRAVLLGELARDPVVTLREAAAAAARFPDPACQATVDELGATLAPFRARAGMGARVVSASVAPGATSASAGADGPSDDALASPEPPPPSSEPVKVTSLQPYGDVESARVVVSLSGPTSFKMGVAPPREKGAGPRVYVDIAHAVLGKTRRDVKVGGLVERVRVGPHEGGARIVLDLSRVAVRRVFYLPEPFRVVIDVSARARGDSPAAAGGKRSVSRVVLDPGHGGNDPGATGAGGLREKDVTLDIAHRAAPVLARELGISTLLTRDKDDYVSLEERTARANAFGAELFVSIHCNASESSAAHGVQTFVLDTTSDDIAGRVAARENASSAQAGTEVSKLLAQLKLAELGTRSTHLAELLQRTAVASLSDKFPGVSDQGVKTAGFYVLVGAQMPAVLFETSFISNASEEARLGSGEYRQRLADAIVNAIKAYREGRLRARGADLGARRAGLHGLARRALFDELAGDGDDRLAVALLLELGETLGVGGREPDPVARRGAGDGRVGVHQRIVDGAHRGLVGEVGEHAQGGRTRGAVVPLRRLEQATVE